MKERRVRVNLRLPADLVRWARKHSKKTKGTFTNLVEYSLRSIEFRVRNQELDKRG